MSSRFQMMVFALAGAILSALPLPAIAQTGELDPELRIERLENQLRQLTGQNEELQYRNRQLEEQIRQLQGNPQAAAPGGPSAAAPRGNPPTVRPNVAVQQPVQPGPVYRQPSEPPPYEQQAAQTPAPVVQPSASPQGRRGDAFDPNQNPNAPGAPRALGGGQLPIPAEEQVGAPGGRGAGEPLDLANTVAPPRDQIGAAIQGGLPPPPQRNIAATGALTTAPPSQTPRDEFDLGIGYIQRKDYALAEETMRSFTQKYPSDRLIADAQYWLGESLFQRQRYRDAAESFLAVTTKFDTSAKAPDALLRLGQSLAALKEKEAACAALGEVVRKYPRASSGVKQGVDREQKRVGC